MKNIDEPAYHSEKFLYVLYLTKIKNGIEKWQKQSIYMGDFMILIQMLVLRFTGKP